jgi:hypothetical protein
MGKEAESDWLLDGSSRTCGRHSLIITLPSLHNDHNIQPTFSSTPFLYFPFLSFLLPTAVFPLLLVA